MTITEHELKGVYIIQPKVFEDKLRGGFFMESYKKKILEEAGVHIEFIQDNHSQSTRGVLRGLHFQKPPFAQDKLVRVVRGEVLDVFVDIRKSSPTYGKWGSVLLTEQNKTQVLVPQGFAHGFVVLTEIADFEYKVSNIYSPEHEGGLVYNDPALGIDWRIEEVIMNDRDKSFPTLAQLESPFN